VGILAVKRINYNTILAMFALVLCAAWTVGWVTGYVIDPGTWPTRYLLLGVGFFTAFGFGLLVMRRWACDIAAAKRYFEVLCHIDPQELDTQETLADLPTLPQSNRWHDVAQQVRDSLLTNALKAHTAETTRASLEIRYRRSVADHTRLQAIVDAVDEPILAVDTYDELTLANPSAQELFDLDSDNTEDRAIAHLVHCEKLVGLLTDTRRRRSPTQRSGEIELTDADGASRWYSVTARTIADDAEAAERGEDSKQGAVAVLRDVSGQKAIQKRNAEFVSSVSHEMKTPLSGIKAYVELLMDGDAEDEQTREEFLSVINGQADRLQRLIDNMLNLARIEAGVVNVSKTKYSLNEILEEALHVVQPAAEAKGIELLDDFSPMYLNVLADRDMLLQAAINLLSNAIKYTPDGGKISFRSRMSDNQIRFEVEDTGVGLSEEDRERIFDKFYRVNKDKNMASGTGLGLPLAKHIVEDVHGGSLTVESILGHGSTFAIVLPNAGQMSS
jgi:two-component system phosphate regulon sensor histidine kinase PhoR